MNKDSKPNVPEKELINGCINKDRKMQEMLYHRFSSRMYAVCLRYCRNAEEADDLLQEGFIKIFRNLHKFRAEGSFEGWVRRIFVNTAIEHFRKSLRYFYVPVPDGCLAEDAASNVLNDLAAKDLIKMIQELSPGYRQVLNLYIQGYSHKNIGYFLGITEGTSKSQLARAKRILKRNINRKTAQPSSVTDK